MRSPDLPVLPDQRGLRVRPAHKDQPDPRVHGGSPGRPGGLVPPVWTAPTVPPELTERMVREVNEGHPDHVGRAA